MTVKRVATRSDERLLLAGATRFQQMLQDPVLRSFFEEARNMLFAMCLDGMNPFNSGTYSLMPMLLMHLGLPAHVSLFSCRLVIITLRLVIITCAVRPWLQLIKTLLAHSS